MSPGSATQPGAVLGEQALAGHLVTEARRDQTLRLSAWERASRGLVCGITLAEAGDFGVAAGTAAGLLDAYGGLARTLGFAAVAVPLQVHGGHVTRVRWAGEADGEPPTLLLTGRLDGQATRSAGCLLAATAADCVPVFAVREGTRAVGLAHAGWRGVAAGIAGRLLRELAEVAGARGAPAEGVRIHLGPAICGRCYEVDEPVLAALGLPGERARVDLRGLLVERLLTAGVPRDALTVSSYCTRCEAQLLHSHRGSGDRAGRMAAFLGFRTDA